MNRPGNPGSIFLLVLCVITELSLNAELAAQDGQRREQRPALEFVPSARPRTDAQLRQAFMRGIAKELEGGKYDELETQFIQFHKPGEELEDGSRKIWLYFAAFENRTAFALSLDDAKAFVHKAEAWTRAKPASVAADLAYCEALFGEMAKIVELARKRALDAGDPKVIQALMDLVGECKGRIITPPEELLPALNAEPESYSAGIQLLAWTEAGFDQVQAVFKETSLVDPFYVPIYLHISIWLTGKHPREEGAPKPGAWLTKILKPRPADSKSVRQKKIITYAQTVGLFPAPSQLDPRDLDWSTLKVGLFRVARTHKGSLDWPSRCLALAYAFRDAKAAQEALALIQGNYSPEVFHDPATFQEISRWAEKASKKKSKQGKPKPKANTSVNQPPDKL